MKPKGAEAPAPTSKPGLNIDVQKEKNYLLDLVFVRGIFAVALTAAAYEIQPFGLAGPTTVALGLAAALGIIYFEYRLKTATLKRLIGAAIGSLLGITGAAIINHVLGANQYDKNLLSFITVFIL